MINSDPIGYLDEDRTKERTRIIERGNYTFKATCSDPYGFWKVRYEGMRKDHVLYDQVFTSLWAATKAIEDFVNRTQIAAKVKEEQKLIKKQPKPLKEEFSAPSTGNRHSE